MPPNDSDGTPGSKSTQSSQYRIAFTNTFRMRFGDNDVAITFGVEVMDENEVMSVVEQATIFMSPRSAKILAHTLAGAITQFEARAGLISMPEGKLEKIDEIFSVQGQLAAAKASEK